MINFNDFGELVKLINTSLGHFCNEFGAIRKDLAGLGKSPKRDILFTYDYDKGNPWAINEGGGTEIQYHIYLDEEDLHIRYGLGFNTQYVPFKNKTSTVGYMKPFMDAYLNNENRIKEILDDYSFIESDIEMLKNPQHDKYVLFGKSQKVTKTSEGYSIEDEYLNEIINDLQKQIEVYKLIFEERNKFRGVSMSLQKIIDVLYQKGQIILQGPPGTGKTYTAKDMAEMILFSDISVDKITQKKNLEGTEQFKLIQFHPAYTYEDFVRGIVAQSKDNFIEYTTENKVIAEFAKRANENYENQKKPKKEFSKEKWVEEKFNLFVDHIKVELEENDIYNLTSKISIVNIDPDAFRYKGMEGWTKYGQRMLFKDIKQAYLDENNERQDIVKNSKLSGLANWHATYYIKVLKAFKEFLEEKDLVYQDEELEIDSLKYYILIIDEINRANLPAVLGELIYAMEYRGEKVESMYAIDYDNNIIIPPNLLIIGTMNTADRSVGHIDYAIRRRFAFIDVLPKILEGDSFELELFKRVSELFIKNFDEYRGDNSVQLEMSEHLSEEFRPEDVWLGHSYFIKNDLDFSLRKKYEIIPILKEYVKDGILKQSAETIINRL